MRAGLIVALWAVAAVLIMSIVALPISLQAHLVAGLTVVACMIIIKFMRAQGIWRLIALALGTAIVLRYVFWRTTSTIPPITEVASFIPGFLLYLAEMYSVMMLFLSLFVVSSPLPSRKAPQIDPRTCRPSTSSSRPTTRMPTCWPPRSRPQGDGLSGRQDDGLPSGRRRHGREVQFDRPARRRGARAPARELQALCARLDVNYLTRARNVHAKAGNLNNGLEHSNGELVAVFDADHAPAAAS